MSNGTDTRQTLIGVTICVTGNICISLALNIQKLAHQNLEKENSSNSSTHPPRAFEVSLDGVPTERAPLLGNPRQKSPSGSSISVPSTHVALVIPATANNKIRIARPRVDKVYLQSKLWWFGLSLLNLGELGNFLAYAFSPASLVAPLGTVALVANCFIAPLVLKEPFRSKDIVGILLAVLGGVTIVFASRESDQKLRPHELLVAIKQLPFIIYGTVSLSLGVVLASLSTSRYGDQFLMIDLGICALAGGFTVLSTKAFSSFLSILLLDTFKQWLTYPILAVLIVTALIQINYINKALQRFESRIVIPAQFCLFSLSAIVGSAILYREFDGIDFNRFLNFVFGCALSGLGVYILTRSNQEPPDLSTAGPGPRPRPRIGNVRPHIPTSNSTRSLHLQGIDIPEQHRNLSIRARPLSVTLGGSNYLLAQSPNAPMIYTPALYYEGDEPIEILQECITEESVAIVQNALSDASTSDCLSRIPESE